MGNNINNSDTNDDCFVETINMNSYMNYSNQPHTLTITHRKTNTVFLKKVFPTETEAINYLYEARNFKNNKSKFSFVISGPNMYLCT